MPRRRACGPCVAAAPGRAGRGGRPARRRRPRARRRPDSRATAAMASLRGWPAAIRRRLLGRRRGGPGGRARLVPAAAAPSTTRVTSPSTPSAAQAASSASVPRRTSSWVLVSSRQTTARRSGPNARGQLGQGGRPACAATRRTPWSAARRPARRTCGPARRPCAAGSPRSRTGRWAARTRPARRSRRTARAARVTGAPGRGRRRDQPVPGVADRRHARVGDQQHVLAVAQRVEQQARLAAALDRVVVRDDLPGRYRRRGRRPACAAAGCPRPRSPAVAGQRLGEQRRRVPGRPMGTAATSGCRLPAVAGVHAGDHVTSRSRTSGDPAGRPS